MIQTKNKKTQNQIFYWVFLNVYRLFDEVESCLTFSVDGIQKNVDNYVENFWPKY